MMNLSARSLVYQSRFRQPLLPRAEGQPEMAASFTMINHVQYNSGQNCVTTLYSEGRKLC